MFYKEEHIVLNLLNIHRSIDLYKFIYDYVHFWLTLIKVTILDEILEIHNFITTQKGVYLSYLLILVKYF